MIVSLAPFRVSFAGGGSDIAQFYRRSRGAVLSCAIAKYAFVVVHPFFNASKYHLKYARTELIDRLDDIQHPILREALRMLDIRPGIEVVSIADIPAGTGLGSSSSFSVALLNALYAHRRFDPGTDQPEIVSDGCGAGAQTGGPMRLHLCAAKIASECRRVPVSGYRPGEAPMWRQGPAVVAFLSALDPS